MQKADQDLQLHKLHPQIHKSWTAWAASVLMALPLFQVYTCLSQQSKLSTADLLIDSLYSCEDPCALANMASERAFATSMRGHGIP